MDAITAISIHLATVLYHVFLSISFFLFFLLLSSPAVTDFSLRKNIKDTLESVVKLHGHAQMQPVHLNERWLLAG